MKEKKEQKSAKLKKQLAKIEELKQTIYRLKHGCGENPCPEGMFCKNCERNPENANRIALKDIYAGFDKVVEYAKAHPQKSFNSMDVRKFQIAIMKHMDDIGLTDMINTMLDNKPELKDDEFIRELMAVTAEGKRFKDSMLNNRYPWSGGN